MTPRRALRFVAATVLAVAWLCATPAFAQSVRGQVVFANGAPFAGANVRICGQACSTFAVSGIDGMYYLYEIPPGGPYTLQIWVGPGVPRREIQVFVQPGWTDILPIAL